MQKISHLILALAAMGTAPAQAAWQLDGSQSTLTFVSTKAINAAEVHRFAELSGNVDDAGQAIVTIGLASVDTNIELRDERMREMLFETGDYATATIKAAIDAGVLAGLDAGASVQMTIEGELLLHGESGQVPFSVVVTRAGDDRLVVASAAPVIVNASQFGLADGVGRLQEVAGLPSISLAVPVSFVLVFEAS